MDKIGVIPENSEIRRFGRKVRKSFYHFVRIGLPGRIGKFWYAPNAFDGVVLANKAFDQIHVRPVFFHGNADHFNPEMLADGEMPVVAGNWAKKFYFFQAAPWFGRSVHAVEHSAGYRIVHHIQAGISADNHIFRRDSQQVSHEFFGFRDAVQTPVIAAVGPVGCRQIAMAAQNIQHRRGQNQLIWAWLAPGHIQMQALLFVCFIFLPVRLF